MLSFQHSFAAPRIPQLHHLPPIQPPAMLQPQLISAPQRKKACSYFFKKGRRAGEMCGKNTLTDKCKLHSKSDNNLHAMFVGNLLIHSVSKNLQDAMKEWQYDNEFYSGRRLQCFCGFKHCKNVTYYRNVKNNKRIIVGSQCKTHFADSDAYLDEDTEYFTREGYEKDGFVVADDEEIIYEEQENEREQKYPEESKEEWEDKHSNQNDFVYDRVLKMEGKMCLIQWAKTRVTKQRYLELLEEYDDQISEQVIDGDEVTITWENTWEPRTVEYAENYLNRH